MHAHALIFACVFATLYAAHHIGDQWIQTHTQACTKGTAEAGASPSADKATRPRPRASPEPSSSRGRCRCRAAERDGLRAVLAAMNMTCDYLATLPVKR